MPLERISIQPAGGGAQPKVCISSLEKVGGYCWAVDWQGLDWTGLTAKVEFPRLLHPLSGSVGCVTGGARCHPGRLTGALARSCPAVLRNPQGVLQLGSSWLCGSFWVTRPMVEGDGNKPVSLGCFQYLPSS